MSNNNGHRSPSSYATAMEIAHEYRDSTDYANHRILAYVCVATFSIPIHERSIAIIVFTFIIFKSELQWVKNWFNVEKTQNIIAWWWCFYRGKHIWFTQVYTCQEAGCKSNLPSLWLLTPSKLCLLPAFLPPPKASWWGYILLYAPLVILEVRRPITNQQGLSTCTAGSPPPAQHLMALSQQLLLGQGRIKLCWLGLG